MCSQWLYYIFDSSNFLIYKLAKNIHYVNYKYTFIYRSISDIELQFSNKMKTWRNKVRRVEDVQLLKGYWIRIAWKRVKGGSEHQKGKLTHWLPSFWERIPNFHKHNYNKNTKKAHFSFVSILSNYLKFIIIIIIILLSFKIIISSYFNYAKIFIGIETWVTSVAVNVLILFFRAPQIVVSLAKLRKRRKKINCVEIFYLVERRVWTIKLSTKVLSGKRRDQVVSEH